MTFVIRKVKVLVGLIVPAISFQDFQSIRGPVRAGLSFQLGTLSTLCHYPIIFQFKRCIF